MRMLPQIFIASTLYILGLWSAQLWASDIPSWESHCQQTEMVSARVGEVSASELVSGMRRLQQAGSLRAIEQLDLSEACLSLVATAITDKPVFTVFARLPSETRHQNTASVAHLREFYEREHLADRLANMGINLHSGVQAGSGARQDHSDRVYSNRAVLAGAVNHRRSYAAVGEDICVVSLRPESLAEHLQTRQTYVWGMLSGADQATLARRGEAYEFWHEVGHCAPEYTAAWLSGNSQLVGQLEAWSDEKQEGIEQCNDTGALELWKEAMNRRVASAESVRDLQGEPDPIVMNRFIHYELIKESLADQFSTRMTALRFGEDATSCTSKQFVQEPWYRLRLAWSVRQPDARYMTWLTPWLSGLAEEAQHQVMVDAHSGSTTLTEAMLPKPLWMELEHSRQSRPDKHRITDPNGIPNQGRSEAWSSWISQNLDAANGLIE